MHCTALLGKIRSFEVDINGYDAYRTCYQPSTLADGRRRQAVTIGDLIERIVDAGESPRAALLAWARDIREKVPCINSVQGTAYLNLPEVKKALHVEDSPNTWAICGGVNYKDDGVFSSMLAVHRWMMTHAKPKVLVYNGDVDPGCNYLWAEASVARFGRAVTKDWHPWVYGESSKVGEQLGGFVTEYDGDVNFATVHGAGHMSPQWRPMAVFNMLERFLTGKPI